MLVTPMTDLDKKLERLRAKVARWEKDGEKWQRWGQAFARSMEQGALDSREQRRL